MASQVKTPARSANAKQTSASVRQAQKVKDYVNVQLEKTRKQVKIVDLIASVLLMLATVVGFLLLLVIVDAWIWPLSATARWTSLILIVGGCLGYSVIAILPLFLKQINPDYAAKMIEEAKPSFRNSLINYVSFRKRPDDIKPAVFDAVSRQAAADLASVPGDATVDQSKLIRLGFVLIGLTVFAVGYKMLSPKDPLQTLARVVAPAAQIAKPAVVRIEDVQPGDTAVFFGEQLVVTATVRGQHQPEDVRLVYSTLDGQLSDQTVSMTPGSSPNQYETKLSMASGGIQSSLQYRVEALDGQSPDYTVTVRPNPSIAIESLVLSPPAYTKMAERTLTGVGDVEAIEGTQVTVHAVANLPIKIAYIELLKDIGDANQAFGNVSDTDQENRFRTVGASIKMAVQGKSAVGRFRLKWLDTARTQPFASHYRVRFVSTGDDRNNQPNVYPIRVIPDLAPEIKFRNPVKSDVQLPINGVLAIDVQANDLDFVLTEIRLKVDQAGSKRLDESLQMFSTDGNRRATAKYLLRPSEIGLNVGDRAVFVAMAADNRVSNSSGQPDPNVSRTANYSVTIVEFDQETEEAKGEAPEEKADSPENEDPSEQDGNDKGDSEENGGNDGGASGDEPGEEDRDAGSDSDPGEEGEAGSDEGTGQSGGAASDTPEGDPEANGSEGAQGGAGNNDPGENQPSDPKSGASGSGEPSSEGDQSEKQEGGAGSASDGNSSNAGDGNQPPNQDQPRSEGEPQDSGDEGSGGDGTQDSSLTEGAQEKMSDAPPGAQMQQLEEFFNDDEDASDEPQDSEPSDTPSDDGSSNQPTKQTGDPTTGDSGNSTGNDQPGKPEEGAPGDGNPADAQSDPPEAGDPEAGDPAEGNPNDQETGDPESGEEPGKPSNNNQPTENQSSSQGAPEGNQGPDPDGPKNDGQNPAEDSENNERAREQSAKPGLEDATGKQSQDAGGNETQKTGNESGGSDPGESKSGDDPGENPGESEAGNPGSEPGNGDSETDTPQGNDPGQEGGQGDAGQPKPGEGTKGESGQPGDSGQPGEDSAQPSGQPSETKGGAGDSGEPSSNPPSNEQGESKKPSQPKSSDGNSENTGGGGGGGGSSGNEALERDAKNLEHARKATELVLKKLADQRYDPDPELLKKMNWTKDDLAKFLDRWEEMRRAAQTGGDAEKRKYDRSLRSLNLRPKDGGRIVDQLDERADGISEDSRVNRPTPELAPDFNAFMNDLNRADDDN